MDRFAPKPDSMFAPARMWRVVRLLALAWFAFISCGPSVIAENNGSSSTFFLQERQQGNAQRLQPLRAPRAVRVQPLRRSAPAIARVPNYRTAPASATNAQAPAVAPSMFVAVLGDSLGVLLAQGLQDAYADRPEIAVLRKSRESSGLVRDDFYDWSKAAVDLLAGAEHIDVAIMIIGSNDRQEIPDKTSPIAFRTQDGSGIASDWLDIYGNRVEALATKFREKHIPLIWVGMPVMKNEKMSAELLLLNEIFRARAAKAGAVYIDIWEAFLNDASKFDAFGPDMNGEIVKLRTADGIHFTKPGARKLAHFVEAEIKRVLDGIQPSADPVLASLPLSTAAPEPGIPALPAPINIPGSIAPAEPDINDILRRQIGAPTGEGQTVQRPGDGESLLASLPLPAEPPPLFLPLRPAAGPLFMLTALPLAPGGELASLKDKKLPVGDIDGLAEQAFSQGQLPSARPGRADSFPWPAR